MRVILADAEKEYVDAVLAALSRMLPGGIELLGCCSMAEWSGLVPDAAQPGPPVLCLFNPVDFPAFLGFDDRAGGNGSRKYPVFFPLSPGLAAEPPDGMPAGPLAGSGVAPPAGSSGKPQQLCRLGSPRLFARMIEEQARCHSAADTETTGPGSGHPTRLNMLLCLDPAGYRPAFSRQRLHECVAGGSQVIYLPVMPTYQMLGLSIPGRGPCLSDLLLRLLGQDNEKEKVSRYLEPHPDGYLQFRPPDRSDDLVLCSPDLLRRLLALLREMPGSEAASRVVLIDCAGIPLATAACLAVLCDSCEVILPEARSFAGQAAQREAGILLAALPSGCAVIENRPARFIQQDLCL
jgi:hypothetical protein